MSISPPLSTQDFDIEILLRELPRGKRWLEHLKKDLLPFWTMPSALGEPLGNFPTYRNNDGSLVDPTKGRPELERLDYVRAKSRQCFGYGVAYHMTGEEEYLNYAKAGVAFLREKAIDRVHGGAFSYFSSPGAIPGQGEASKGYIHNHPLMFTLANYGKATLRETRRRPC